jgi:dienelactone hydrolase
MPVTKSTRRSVAVALALMFLNGAFFLPAVLIAAVAEPSDPAVQARQFIDSLAKEDFAGAQSLLSVDMAAKLPSATLKQIWQGLQKQAGAYQRSGSAQTEPGEKSDVVFLTCIFEKMRLDARVPVDKEGRITGLSFRQHTDYSPPDYVKTDSFHEQEVIVGSGEWSVHGTLTIPHGEGPFSAVVLVAGSGPADRDSTLGPNKPFRDLAWGIASRGIAVLRYNKRANEHPDAFSNLAIFTVREETTDDALLAVALLRATPSVSAKKVFVLGHSLGGTLAPRIGKTDPGVAGLIILAGTTHTLLDLFVPQFRHNFTLHGPMTEKQQKMLDTIAQQVARAKDPNLSASTPKEEMPLATPASYWLDLRGYHPEIMSQGLQQPMLILQAERDYQVTMEDWGTWKTGLAGKSNVQFKSYPRLNHLFMEGEGVSSDEEYVKPGHIPGLVVEDIANWIKLQ